MEKRGYLYSPVGWAGFRYYDVYNPAANDLYWQYVNKGLFSKGIDGWWMDSTEPDIVNALTKEGEEYEMKRVENNHLGSFARYLNPYSLLVTEAVYNHQRAETDQKRVYILTRSTFAGQQRAAATTWSGDIGANWDVYKKQISAGINHCMSGIPYWTFDIGAFNISSYEGVFSNGGKDPAYQEFYTRMFQLGAFSPIFRSHGSETPREIWEFGEFTNVLVKFDNLRYRLMPYIYSLAWQVTDGGYTIMRGLPMDFTADKKTYGIDDQFMFGPAMMVCPVTEYMIHRPPENSILITPEHFKTKDGQPGLTARYYADSDFKKLVHEQVETNVNLFWYTGWPSYITSPKFSMRWEGKLTPTETGTLSLPLQKLRAKTGFSGRPGTVQQLRFDGSLDRSRGTSGRQGIRLCLRDRQLHPRRFPGAAFLENPGNFCPRKNRRVATANPAGLSARRNSMGGLLDRTDSSRRPDHHRRCAH